MKKQKGFVIAIVLGMAFWLGAVGVAVVNSDNHPEVSKPGRS